MISPIKYIASSGKEYDLVSNGVVHCSANYYDWHWSAVGTVLQYGVRIANFSKQPAEYDAELFIYGTACGRGLEKPANSTGSGLIFHLCNSS